MTSSDALTYYIPVLDGCIIVFVAEILDCDQGAADMSPTKSSSSGPMHVQRYSKRKTTTTPVMSMFEWKPI